MMPLVHAALQRSATISIELSDAPPGPTPYDRVDGWLQLHRESLARAEMRFHVDRRAIAAVIAWEAIFDIEPSYYGGFAKFAGPGKVHYKEFRLGAGATAAFEIEEMGILPRRSFMDRLKLLETPDGAITYIAAIMHGFDLYSRQTLHASIACNVPLLTTLYTAYSPRGARSRFERTRSVLKLRDNAAGRWAHSAAHYLGEAAGTANPAVCSQATSR